MRGVSRGQLAPPAPASSPYLASRIGGRPRIRNLVEPAGFFAEVGLHVVGML